MKAVREIWIAGKTIGVTIKLPTGNHTKKRAERQYVTADKVRKNNDRIAKRNLAMLINANFGAGDAHFTLTHAVELTQDQAAKERENFIKRLSRRFKKVGKELKYIIVTEYKNKRIHHHMIVNSSDVDLVEEAWGRGHVYCSKLDDTGDYQNLAEYLVKETQKTFRESDSVYRSRYSASRNLIRPEIVRQDVNMSKLFEDPKPIRGYYIPDS